MDAPEVRPLIQDFLEHAQWFLFHRVKDRTIPGLMLKKPIGGGYLPMKGIFEDRVGGARHYIGLYGVHWIMGHRIMGNLWVQPVTKKLL